VLHGERETTERTEATEKNSLFGSVCSVRSVVDLDLHLAQRLQQLMELSWGCGDGKLRHVCRKEDVCVGEVRCEPSR